jgi:MFS family permease
MTDETLAQTEVPGASEAAPPSTGGILRPLAGRDFRLLFIGQTVSLIGDQFHFIALAWLALELTGSGLALGTVLLVAGVPRMILVLFGGALADRISPRTVMLASNALRAVVVGLLAVLVVSGRAEIWMLYPFALVFGAVDAFFWPAEGAIVPMLVTEEELPAANGLNQGSQQLTNLVGPALAGVFVAAVGTGWAFGIDAASFAFAALALSLIVGGRRPARAEASDEPGMLSQIRSGLVYVWRDRPVLSLILLSAVLNFAINGPVTVGLAWMAPNRFGGEADAYGFMLAAFGAGALIGAIAAGSVGRVPQLGWVTVGASVILGITLTLIGLAPSVPAVMAIAIVTGLTVGFINVRVVAWLQTRAPESMVGRVMSLAMMGGIVMSPISFGLAGLIVDLGWVTQMFIGGGILIGIAALAAILWDVPTQMREA